MDNFNYQTINGQVRALGWTTAAWTNMLKGELDLHRPIIDW